MGIRQAVNDRPMISTGITVVIIVVALGVILWEAFSRPGGGTAVAARAFYSDDDGKTYFADSGNKLPPFTDANGKEAVRVFVFKCGQGGTPFVGYLMRASQEARDAAAKAGRPNEAIALNPMFSEVKKPGGKAWVKFDPKNPRFFQAVLNVRCPDGGKPISVQP